ncbi:MAG: methylated-DNA--[protein]-cysteine S-methyltransferase [Treponemataceae bacterium]
MKYFFSSPIGIVEIQINENNFLTHCKIQTAPCMIKETSYTVNSPTAQIIIAQLSEYFSCQRKTFDILVNFDALDATAFQKSVWKALQTVPYGSTLSYKQLSQKIGKPTAFRAVANALNKNPLLIFFPCHRVILANGSLGGFAYGNECKQFLLNLERSATVPQ